MSEKLDGVLGIEGWSKQLPCGCIFSTHVMPDPKNPCAITYEAHESDALNRRAPDPNVARVVEEMEVYSCRNGCEDEWCCRVYRWLSLLRGEK